MVPFFNVAGHYETVTVFSNRTDKMFNSLSENTTCWLMTFYEKKNVKHKTATFKLVFYTNQFIQSIVYIIDVGGWGVCVDIRVG